VFVLWERTRVVNWIAVSKSRLKCKGNIENKAETKD